MSIEKNLERRLIKDVHHRGGYCIKILPFAETGLPDRQCILPGGITVYVELKSGGTGILEGKQLVWRNRLLKLGHDHWVIFSEKSYNCFLEHIDAL